MSAKARTYRFPARDRTGWLLGLQATQCLILGAGIVVCGALLNASVPGPAILGVALASGVAAFASVGGRPVYGWIPIAAASAIRHRQHTWVATVPRVRLDGTDAPIPDLPPFLTGISLDERPGWRAGQPMAVVTDRGTVTAFLRVVGREFSLIDRTEQDRLLAAWGDVLAGFCRERSPVVAVRWYEWSAPAQLVDHREWASTRVAADASPDFVNGYLDLVADAGPLSGRHEAIVALSTESGPLTRRRRNRPESTESIDTLREEARLLAARLTAAGLHAEGPCSLPEVAVMLRDRLDPVGRGSQPISGAPTLAALSGLAVANAGPMAVRTTWRHVEVDRTFHATFAVTEWPRLDVPANWMEALLLHTAGTRSIAMHLEPVPPSVSHRRVERDSTRLAVDTEQRSRHGFRIGARQRRSAADVSEREAELVAGYCELDFCALITVSAPDSDSLERAAAEWQQVAAQVGIDLRRLDGQHDAALATTLPLGIAPRKQTVQ